MAMLTRRADKADALAQVPLFGGLTKSQLMEVARVASEHTFKAGRRMTVEGQQGHQAFVLLDGTVEVRRKGRKVATRGPGEVIGEMSLVDREPRSATCVAEGDVVALVVEERDFRALLDATPGLATRLLASMSRRLRETEQHI